MIAQLTTARWRTALLGGIATLLAFSAGGPTRADTSSAAGASRTILVLDPRVASTLQPAERNLLRHYDDASVDIRIAALLSSPGCYGWSTIPNADRPSLANDSLEAAGRFDIDASLRDLTRTTVDSSDRMHIVLVTAGGAECLSIARSLAAGISTNQPGLRIDVVALEGSAESLSCLATATGGVFQHLDGSTPIHAAFKLIEPSAPSELPQTALLTEPEVPIIGVEDAASANTADNADASDSDESSAAPPTQDKTSAEQVTNTGAPPPIPRPRPGSPTITPALQTAEISTTPKAETLETPGTVPPLAWAAPKPGAAEAEPPTDPETIGALIRVVAGAQGPLILSDLTVEILSPEGGAHRVIAQSSAQKPFFSLPAGRFIARITHAGIVRTFPFETEGKKLEYQTFSMNLGYVHLIARPTAAASPLETPLTYTVSRLGYNASGAAILARREAQPTIALPAGTYRILAQSGAARAITDVTVTPGATIHHAFNLNLGYLRVEIEAAADDDLSFRLETQRSADGSGGKLLDIATGPFPMFRAPAGRHTLVAKINNDTSRHPVTVVPGKLTSLTLDVQTAAQKPPPR
jgi:hypothetical protein